MANNERIDQGSQLAQDADAMDRQDGRNGAGSRASSESTTGNGQQGTGGVESGQATSTPGQTGSQPHLGSGAGHAGTAAPGGTGETEGGYEARAGSPRGPDELDAIDRTQGRNDGADFERGDSRLDLIGVADDRTADLNPERDAGAELPGETSDDADNM